jgi:DNA modification methylase/predicted RNA-binding Zn-ribbon protein involved in translation (DUF1610 family)
VKVHRQLHTGAHSYHTVVPYPAVLSFIEQYTNKGDIVLDSFAGSGQTGIAALISGRRALLTDISPAATHISRGFLEPVDLGELNRTFNAIEKQVKNEIDLKYSTLCRSCGRPSTTHYFIWSEKGLCPNCGASIVLFESETEDRRYRCQKCGSISKRTQIKFESTQAVAVSYTCPQCGREEVGVTPEDMKKIQEIDVQNIPYWYPTTVFESSREMWRGVHGQYQINDVSRFFTKRNLWALACLWHAIQNVSEQNIRNKLMFVATATMVNVSRMVVCMSNRAGRRNLSGTLYIPAVSLEQNVWLVFNRRFRRVTRFLDKLGPYYNSAERDIRISTQSATNLDNIPTNSVDYVFIDPPFGSNLFYTDLNLIWESWLGHYTDSESEAVVGIKNERNSIQRYSMLMQRSFQELFRVLKPGRVLSVLFQNTNDSIWLAIQDAAIGPGFILESVSTVDKITYSYKRNLALFGSENVQFIDIALMLRKPINGKGSVKFRVLTPDELQRKIFDAAEALVKRHLRGTEIPLVKLHLVVVANLLRDSNSVKGLTITFLKNVLSQKYRVTNGRFAARDRI